MVFLFFFLLGAIIGSFLNVVALRVEQGTDFVHGRSACPKCKACIAWYDNIPLFSFLVLQGKCRTCHTPIAWRYPLVECVTGGVYVMTAVLFLNPVLISTWIETVWLLGLFSLGIVIALHDWQTMEIPVVLLWVSAGWSALFIAFLDWQWSIGSLWSVDSRIGSGVAAACGAWIFFAALSYFSRETWMGWGDAWLAALIGFAVGLKGILFALTLGFGSGALFSCVLLLRKQAGMETRVPFGPFLVIGMILYFLLSHLEIVRYSGLLWM